MIRGAPPLGPGAPAARAPDRVRPRLPGVPRPPRRAAAAPPRARTRRYLASAPVRLLPHPRRAAAARGRPRRSRRLPRRRRPRPRWPPPTFMYHRGARQLSLRASWSTLIADLVRAPPRLNAMSDPVVPASVEEVADGLQAAGYLPGESTALVAYLAARLGKPVLVEGPAGVGKTELAKALADLPAARPRAPAVLRGPRRGQGAVRVELPQAAAADPGRGRGHRLAGRPGRHLRRGVPAHAARCCRRSPRPSRSCC